MIIAKHPGIKKILSKMASEAGFPGTGKMSRCSLIIDRDHIYLLGQMNGRTILAQGNFHSIGVHVTHGEGDLFLATRYFGDGTCEKHFLGDVVDHADHLPSEAIVAWSDDLAGGLFRSKRKARSSTEPMA